MNILLPILCFLVLNVFTVSGICIDEDNLFTEKRCREGENFKKKECEELLSEICVGVAGYYKKETGRCEGEITTDQDTCLSNNCPEEEQKDRKIASPPSTLSDEEKRKLAEETALKDRDCGEGYFWDKDRGNCALDRRSVDEKCKGVEKSARSLCSGLSAGSSVMKSWGNQLLSRPICDRKVAWLDKVNPAGITCRVEAERCLDICSECEQTELCQNKYQNCKKHIEKERSFSDGASRLATRMQEQCSARRRELASSRNSDVDEQENGFFDDEGSPEEELASGIAESDLPKSEDSNLQKRRKITIKATRKTKTSRNGVPMKISALGSLDGKETKEEVARQYFSQDQYFKDSGFKRRSVAKEGESIILNQKPKKRKDNQAEAFNKIVQEGKRVLAATSGSRYGSNFPDGITGMHGPSLFDKTSGRYQILLLKEMLVP